MDVMLAEYILQLNQGIKKIGNVLLGLTEKDEINKEILDITKTLEKCLIMYHKNISEFSSKELNDLFNRMSKLLKRFNSINEIKTMLRNVCFYLSETEFVLNKIKNQIGVIKQNYVNTINNISTTKKKIVVLGIDGFTVNINQLLKQTETEIIAFCTSDIKYKWNKINGIPVIGTEMLEYLQFDCLIIGEDSNHIFNQQKTIDLFGYINKFYDFEISRVMSEFSRNKNEINGIITGLSYAETGIDVKTIKNINFLNAALSSQDLYYDFELVKYFLSFENINKNIKYVIINLGYASFQYDLSLSINKHRTYFYYPFIKKLHHNVKMEIITKYNNFMNKANNILKDNFHMIIYDLLKVNAQKNWDLMMNREIGQMQIEQAEIMVAKDCNKNYPLTVKENVSILEEYIEFLQSRNIRPFITICPTNEHYNQIFSKRIKTEFREIIEDIRERYNLAVLDYFESNQFTDEDFYDVSHLNNNGATKFTEILNGSLFDHVGVSPIE